MCEPGPVFDTAETDEVAHNCITKQFPKDILLARKNNLEAVINSLKEEQTTLNVQLTVDQLTEEDIRAIQKFALMVRQGLQLAANNFEAKRKIIDLLDVKATLVIENNKKVVYTKCLIDDTTMTITSKTIGGLPAVHGH